MPAYLLYRAPGEDWSGRLLDLMWYGRTFLFDGSPVVEDVWIDSDDDNVKATDGSEWRRVVVVQQGKGGPVTLALDITDTQDPRFLWEQTNTSDYASRCIVRGVGLLPQEPRVLRVGDVQSQCDRTALALLNNHNTTPLRAIGRFHVVIVRINPDVFHHR